MVSIAQGNHLVLAGAGHSHTLLLHRWAMYPSKRPSGLVTLVNRSSTFFYSSMVPGLIAGLRTPDELTINLRQLADCAGVALVISEIIGLSLADHLLLLRHRPPIAYHYLSLNVGAETQPVALDGDIMPIKPLGPALSWLARLNEDSGVTAAPVTVVGAGLAGVEVALALRRRWPQRRLNLQAKPGQPCAAFRRALVQANIVLSPSGDPLTGPSIICSGSRAPSWIAASGLVVNRDGRVLTDRNLQVPGHDGLLAMGDCAVVATDPRPAAGVWAVRAAATLAQVLEKRHSWMQLPSRRPQQHALQLLGGMDRYGHPQAWALWGPLLLGPHRLIWWWKEMIDRRFMDRFSTLPVMVNSTNGSELEPQMACRGCAAKLAAEDLLDALQQAGLDKIREEPEDAPYLGRGEGGEIWLQSVDGFPALSADPWLNGRLVALHACSDLWASGAEVRSAQAIITLPAIQPELQRLLLAATLQGIRSVLIPQGADLIGGHTMESRQPPAAPASRDLEVTLSVNGSIPDGQTVWRKTGLQPGDILLMSRPLGTGVLFAAAMSGEASADCIDQALAVMNHSQAPLLTALRGLPIHAATDITGFGLLGHLGEMLKAGNQKRRQDGLSILQITLDSTAVPALPGALQHLRAGRASSLAPANRRAWSWLKPIRGGMPPVCLIPAAEPALLDLLVDPQTCGPMLIAVPSSVAVGLETHGPWQRIGVVEEAVEISS